MPGQVEAAMSRASHLVRAPYLRGKGPSGHGGSGSVHRPGPAGPCQEETIGLQPPPEWRGPGAGWCLPSPPSSPGLGGAPASFPHSEIPAWRALLPEPSSVLGSSLLVTRWPLHLPLSPLGGAVPSSADPSPLRSVAPHPVPWLPCPDSVLPQPRPAPAARPSSPVSGPSLQLPATSAPRTHPSLQTRPSLRFSRPHLHGRGGRPSSKRSQGLPASPQRHSALTAPSAPKAHLPPIVPLPATGREERSRG